jgi:hypothetical protein
MRRDHERSEIGEALAKGRYYPSSIHFASEVADNVPPLTLAREYERCLREAGFGTIVRYTVPDMKTHDASGTQEDLEREIQRLGPEEAFAFLMVMKDKTRLGFSRGLGGRPTWTITGDYPSETVPRVEWMEAMAKLSIVTARIPGFQYEVLARNESSWAEFPPQPPLARYNHIVTVTELEVADTYDDPDSFWQCWDRVERVGDIRVCIRGLGDLDHPFEPDRRYIDKRGAVDQRSVRSHGADSNFGGGYPE